MRNGQAYQQKTEKFFVYEEKSLVGLTSDLVLIMFSSFCFFFTIPFRISKKGTKIAKIEIVNKV